MENEMQKESALPEDLTFQKLEEVTKGFSEENKVGAGGYGEVYKGVLDNGIEIAVKKLYPTPGLIDVQFKKEFESLMRVRHPNIIRLVGYCYETRRKYVMIPNGDYVWARMEERALCFEYLQRGSLDNFLSDESCGLHWHTRYQIIKGICEGLNYLHNGYGAPIYHLDLKPENILLDGNMMPIISDFGLSRLFGSTKTHMTQSNIKGTFGYMPPEYIDKRLISKKFDVFSLGIIIIQIMAGKLAYTKCVEMPGQQFIDLVQENWKKRMQATGSFTSQEVADSIEEVKTCIQIAIRCVEADREKRPTIRSIMDKLNDIETMRKSRINQSSVSNLPGLMIDPLELRFYFEVNREISCILQLKNNSDDFVAFGTTVDQSKYSTRPDKGVMTPWSKRYMIMTMQAQEHAPPDMESNDIFLLQSTIVGEEFTPSDITEHLFKNMVAASKVVVNEMKLPIVYVV